MTKPELLKLMRLLSGMESLMMFTQRTNVPDYLLEDLANCTEMLECEILKEVKE